MRNHGAEGMLESTGWLDQIFGNLLIFHTLVMLCPIISKFQIKYIYIKKKKTDEHSFIET